MSNRRRPRPAAAASRVPGPDLGPVQQRANGHVFVAEVPDPANPSRDIRRAHTHNHVVTLLRRGGLELREAVACLRWSELTELEGGARDVPGLLAASVRVEPWMRGHPGEVQLAAAARMRAARACLGEAGSRLMDLYAVEGLSAKALGVRLGTEERGAMGMVRAQLLRLAEHWRL